MTIARPRLEDAACRGMEDLYLKGRPTAADRTRIRGICGACWDRPECLAYALCHEDYGLWAGHTARQLAELRERFGIAFERLSNELWAKDLNAHTGTGREHGEDATTADGPRAGSGAPGRCRH